MHVNGLRNKFAEDGTSSIASAKACLMDPTAKATYDAKLADDEWQLQLRESTKPPADGQFNANSYRRSDKKRAKRRRMLLVMVAEFVVAVAVLAYALWPESSKIATNRSIPDQTPKAEDVLRFRNGTVARLESNVGNDTLPTEESILLFRKDAAEPTLASFATPIVLEGNDVIENCDLLQTRDTFRPPVEITIVAMTDSTNLRMSYAAEQVIFNWEMGRSDLRIDGGPARGRNTSGAGGIPVNTYVTIRWDVRPNEQRIYVDNKLRFLHVGNYARINNPVSVYPYKSKVTVKSITVRPLPPAALPTSAPSVPRLEARGK